MHILYIIGNGFDVAQGLNTRYKDFYPYYLKCDSPNEAVKTMKKDIDDKIDDWSDMEIALGKFTKKVNSSDELTDMYFDLSEKLADYLQKESQRKVFNQNSKVLQDLFEPDRYLEPLDQRYYKAHYNAHYNRDQRTTHIDIITLNYTSTIEWLLGPVNKRNMNIGSTFYNVSNVCHRHGMLGDTILIGVNDEQQISNESFKKDQAVKDLLVKPMAIDAMRSDNDVACKELIHNASIIVLFGVSIGETDANLWKDVVNRLRGGDTMLIYFHHSDDTIPANRKQLLGVKEARTRDYLYSHLGLPESLQLNNKVLVGYNKDIFKIKEDKKAITQSGKFENA